MVADCSTFDAYYRIFCYIIPCSVKFSSEMAFMGGASSKRWLQRQRNDHYVHRAKQEGYVSRAAYKLLEINKKYKILRPGQLVVDLGAAPGGWTQVAQKAIGGKGKVIAVDLLEMSTLPAGTSFVQGDFTTEEVVAEILALAEGKSVNLVLSDMAPNLSGHSSIDQPKMMYLLETALEFCTEVLDNGGCFLLKAFQGAGIDEYYKSLRQHFKSIKTIKPDSSRAASREIYVLAIGFMGYTG